MYLAANVPSIQPKRQLRTYFFNHSVACKAAHAVHVDRTSRLDRVYVFVFVDGSQEKFENAN